MYAVVIVKSIKTIYYIIRENYYDTQFKSHYIRVHRSVTYVVCVVRLGPMFGVLIRHNVYAFVMVLTMSRPQSGYAGEQDETRPHNYRTRLKPYVFAYVLPREFNFSIV